MRLKILVVFIAGLSLIVNLALVNAQSVTGSVADAITNNFNSIQTLPAVISGIKSPVIDNPGWLQSEINAEIAAAAAAQATKAELVKQNNVVISNKNVTYDVSTLGMITADLAEFKTLSNQTYNDSRGWSRLGITFQEVANSGDFTLVLSEASQLPSFSSVCSVDWSCQADKWNRIEAYWRQAAADISGLADVYQFSATKVVAASSLNNIADSWQRLSSANDAKDRYKFEAERIDLGKAYAGLVVISDTSKAQVDKLIVEFNNSYVKIGGI